MPEDQEAQIESLRQQLAALQWQLSIVNAERSWQSEELEMLSRWVEELSNASSALLNSRRWKIGNAFGELLRRISLQPRVPMAARARGRHRRDRVGRPDRRYAGPDRREPVV